MFGAHGEQACQGVGGKTSNESSGMERPSPLALMYASLRVQQLKKPSARWTAGSARSAASSRGEKKRSAISALAKSSRTCSTSTPSSAPRAKANRPRPCECEMLKRRSSRAGLRQGVRGPARLKRSGAADARPGGLEAGQARFAARAVGEAQSCGRAVEVAAQQLAQQPARRAEVVPVALEVEARRPRAFVSGERLIQGGEVWPIQIE